MIAKYTKEELLLMQHTHVVNVVLELQKQIFETKKPDKNSDNSSIPSSQDPISHTKASNTTRDKTWKKTWGQKWHKGTTRPYEEPTKTVDIKPTIEDVIDKAIEYRLVSKHDVIDIEVTKTVTRYQIWEATIDWKVISANVPSYLTANKQFWPKLCSMVSYLNVGQKIPHKRLSEFFNDIFWINVSEWSVNNMLNSMAQKTTVLCEEIIENLKKSEYVWSDETGNSIWGKKWWIWIRQSIMWNYYYPSMSRWYISVKDWFGEDFTWILWHDCFWAQNKTIAWWHQLCLEHIKRDLKYCIEEGKGFWVIAYKMLLILYRSWKAQKRLIEWGIDIKFQTKIRKFYEEKMSSLCLLCESATSTINKIAKRIIKHMDKMFVFLEKLFVPRHNNWSESWLRMEKVHEKISWWFRTLNGAKNYCKILSVIESLKKQWRNIMDGLYQIYTNSFTRTIEAE